LPCMSGSGGDGTEVAVAFRCLCTAGNRSSMSPNLVSIEEPPATTYRYVTNKDFKPSARITFCGISLQLVHLCNRRQNVYVLSLWPATLESLQGLKSALLSPTMKPITTNQCFSDILVACSFYNLSCVQTQLLWFTFFRLWFEDLILYTSPSHIWSLTLRYKMSSNFSTNSGNNVNTVTLYDTILCEIVGSISPFHTSQRTSSVNETMKWPIISQKTNQ
jgi:hypothetical protein